jgi:tetratricopeptide (TPR) repeat protein
MIEIAISPAVHGAISATIEPGNILPPTRNAEGEYLIWLADRIVNKLPICRQGQGNKNKLWRHDLAVSYSKLASVEERLEKKLEYYDDACKVIELNKTCALIEPNAVSDPEFQLDLWSVYLGIGDVNKKQNKFQEALESFNRGLQIQNDLADRYPYGNRWPWYLSISYDRLGDVQFDKYLDSALKSYQSKLDTLKRLTTSDPANAGWQHDLALCYRKLGEIYIKQKEYDRALEAVKAGRVIMANLPALSTGLARWKDDFATWKDDTAWFDEQLSALNG